MSVSRRGLFALVTRGGIGAAAVTLLPRELFGALQAGSAGKHARMIPRSARPVDF
jgi:hypothetical protein